jgi:hypothetical protein
MLLSDLTLMVADQGRNIQRSDGSMPEGHNGPHFDRDTPVRNTAHWASIFLQGYLLSDNSEFLKCSELCLSYLTHDFEANGYFRCRYNRFKDQTNGLIGQVWALEPFLLHDIHLGGEGYEKFASRVINAFTFCPTNNLWLDVSESDQRAPTNRTANQQVWAWMAHYLFAQAYGAGGTSFDMARFRRSLNRVLQLDQRGMVNQSISLANMSRLETIAVIRMVLGNPEKLVTRIRRVLRDAYIDINAGYHYFTVFPLFIMVEQSIFLEMCPDEILRPVRSFFSISDSMLSNPFASAYNPVGIENAIIAERLGLVDLAQKSIQFQISNHFSPEDQLMSANTADPQILAARFYEVIYLNEDYEIESTQA